MKLKLKKSFAIIPALTFVVAVVFCFSSAAVSEVTYGDVNNDGFVNVRDVSSIQKVLAANAAADENFYNAADVLLDNDVNVRDVTTLQKYLVGIYTDLPVLPEEFTEPETTSPTEAPTADPYATDPDGWYQHIIKP